MEYKPNLFFCFTASILLHLGVASAFIYTGLKDCFNIDYPQEFSNEKDETTIYFTDDDAPIYDAPLLESSPRLNEKLCSIMKKNDNLDFISNKEIRKINNDLESMINNLSLDEKINTLDELLPKADKYDNKVVSEITSRLSSAMGINKTRAYSPKENVQGQIDFDSIVPYDYVKITRDNVDYLQITYVDKEGRKYVEEKKEKNMTQTEKLSLKLFQRAKVDPNISSMLKTAIGIIDLKAKKE